MPGHAAESVLTFIFWDVLRTQSTLKQQAPLPTESSCLLPEVTYKYLFVFSKFLILPMK